MISFDDFREQISIAHTQLVYATQCCGPAIGKAIDDSREAMAALLKAIDRAQAADMRLGELCGRLKT